ncbi:MAG: ATP-binding cassette domain-containing protein, partial [Roseovarius sp.]|nr:ATP-binding cassette domain-containing protein [Roseovarius sp.]
MSSGYGAAPVLHEVSFDLAENETLAVLGPNGAGKSTLLMSIMGLLPLKQGRVVLDGRDLTGLSPDQRAGAGISWVPEGRRLFPSLTVHENLLVAGRHLHRDDEAERLEE